MVTNKAKNIPSFLVMDILEEAQRLEREGREIIHLEIGEPDFSTPSEVKEAAVKAIQEDFTFYTHSQGLIELREAIAEKYHKKYGVNIRTENITVTLGTSPALFMALSSVVDSESEVLITDPGYPCYKNIIEFVGGKPVPVEIYDDEGYQINIERLKKKVTEKTRAIIVNSPANPTGTLLSRENLQEIAEISKEYGFYLIADEIYHGLVYDEKEVSALEILKNAIVINGFSKTYAMTGWRLGYIISPEELSDSLRRIHQNLFISAASFTQKAAIAALKECDYFIEMVRAEYRKRRDFLLSELRRLGFKVKTTPQGAFYILADISAFDNDSVRFAKKLLHEAGVAVTPGVDFGENSKNFVRFSYANSIENIEKALLRMEKVLR